MAESSNRPAAYELGRELDIDEALALTRRATFDPGEFTKRVRYHEDGEMETLERWQARAVLVALAAREPDDRWSKMTAHITDFEREELKRLGLDRRVRTLRLRLNDARELRRCLDSTLGLLERVCERMPAGPDAFTLRAHLEGGAPETTHLIDQVVAALGGPARDDDETLAKSFRRGYQVAALMAREEETGERDPVAWKEDPDAFFEREMAKAHDVC